MIHTTQLHRVIRTVHLTKAIDHVESVTSNLTHIPNLPLHIRLELIPINTLKPIKTRVLIRQSRT